MTAATRRFLGVLAVFLAAWLLAHVLASPPPREEGAVHVPLPVPPPQPKEEEKP